MYVLIALLRSNSSRKFSQAITAFLVQWYVSLRLVCHHAYVRFPSFLTMRVYRRTRCPSMLVYGITCDVYS